MDSDTPCDLSLLWLNVKLGLIFGIDLQPAGKKICIVNVSEQGIPEKESMPSAKLHWINKDQMFTVMDNTTQASFTSLLDFLTMRKLMENNGCLEQ